MHSEFNNLNCLFLTSQRIYKKIEKETGKKVTQKCLFDVFSGKMPNKWWFCTIIFPCEMDRFWLLAYGSSQTQNQEPKFN